LQRKVVLISALAVGLAVVFGIFGTQLVENEEHSQNLDSHLKEVAQSVLGFAEKLSVPENGPPVFNDGVIFQVWLRNGSVLLHTNTPTETHPILPLDHLGFQDGKVNGADGRKYAIKSTDNKLIVQVAEPMEDYSDELSALFMYSLIPLVIPLLISIVTIWWLQRRSAKSLDKLVDRLHNHNLLDPEPMEKQAYNHEIEPIIEEVNSLFERANKAILTEQRFTAMAAHELRTPWAGIKAQAQIAQTASTNEELQNALQSLVGGINRASHVFEQLFDLARMESMGQDLPSRFENVELSNVLYQVLEELKCKAEAKHIAITARFTNGHVQGLDFAIYLLLRNLLANAVLYTPAGGRIDVSAQKSSHGLVLCVDDSGAGIPQSARVAAFERFNRLDQHGPEGVGLGLSIVMQVAKMHGGQIDLLDSPLGGLRAQITFPPQA
jgi:signal transduction histidine kinase